MAGPGIVHLKTAEGHSPEHSSALEQSSRNISIVLTDQGAMEAMCLYYYYNNLIVNLTTQLHKKHLFPSFHSLSASLNFFRDARAALSHLTSISHVISSCLLTGHLGKIIKIRLKF